MNKFASLYAKIKEELEHDVKNADKSERVAEVIRHQLVRMNNDIANEHLTEVQEKFCSDLLKVSDLAFKAMTAVKSPSTTPAEQHYSEIGIKRYLPPVAGALIGTLVTATMGPVGSVLIVSATTSAGTVIGDSLENTSSDSVQRFEIETGALLENLRQLFGTIDEIVDAYEQELFKERPKPTLEDTGEALKFLQGLMGTAYATNDLQIIKDQIEEIPEKILSHYGVEAKSYEIGIRSDFEVSKSTRSESLDYVTLRPAFFKDGKVLLRGKVIEPSIKGE